MDGLTLILTGVGLTGFAASALFAYFGHPRLSWIVILVPVVAALVMTFAGSSLGGDTGLSLAAYAAFLCLPFAIAALIGLPVGAGLARYLRGRS